MSDADILLGKIAVAKGFVTESQLDELLREMQTVALGPESTPPPVSTPDDKTVVLPAEETVVQAKGETLTRSMSLADLFIRRKMLTVEQLSIVIAGCRQSGVEPPSGSRISELSPIESSSAVKAVPPRPVRPRRQEPGTPFDKYVLQDELGRGGMGVVYKAYDAQLDRHVAIKVMADEFTASTTDVSRFEREARVLARLHHPNVIKVHDIGVRDSRHYYVMDLLRGETLETVLKREKRLPERVAFHILACAAEALHHAHSNGIIHRDIKPANIFLESPGEEDARGTDGGRPEEPEGESVPARKTLQPDELTGARIVLTDFGLVRDVSSALSRKLTASGFTVGTPQYMSPEQASGVTRNIGPQSDIFSLGITLYETLTGRHPFEAPTVPAILSKIVEADVDSPRSIVPDLSRDAEAVIMKAIAKSPSERYATAKELADDLRRLLKHEPITVRRPGVARKITHWLRRHRRAATITAVTFILACAAGYIFAGPGRVSIGSNPPGARVFVNGVDTGLTTPVGDYLIFPFVEYSIECRLAEHEKSERRVKISARQRLRFEETLVPLFGFITVSSEPRGAELAVREAGQDADPSAGWRVIGETPIVMARMPLGDCAYRLALEGYDPTEGNITLLRGVPGTLVQTLKRQTGQISVPANVENAEISLFLLGIGDVPAGRTPATGATLQSALPINNATVPTGTYLVRLTMVNNFCPLDGTTVKVEQGKLTELCAEFRSMALWASNIAQTADGKPIRIPEWWPGEGGGSGELWKLVLLAQPASGGTEGTVRGADMVAACSSIPELGTRTLAGSDGKLEWSSSMPLVAKHIFCEPALGDLDGDGTADVVGVCEEGEHLQLRALSGKDGKPAWSFSVPTADPSKGHDFFSPVISDLDRDGSPEIVAGASDGRVYALKMKGAGDTAVLWSHKVGAYVNSQPVQADLTGDGIEDFVVTGNNSIVLAISGSDGKEFWKCRTDQVPYSPAFGELDGDGTPDIVVRTERALFAISGRRGTVFWETPAPGPCRLDGRRVVVLADLDGDGRSDIVAGSLDKSVRAISGVDGKKSLWRFETGSEVAFVPAVFIEAVQGDAEGGRPPRVRVVVACMNGQVFVLDGRDGSVVRAYDMRSPSAASPILVDLDGDGEVDIVTGAGDGVIHAIRMP
ncbi:MAG: protein kinase [Planctomycetota bacterium]|nr:protein kinase [Planctomycetota bacterium]